MKLEIKTLRYSMINNLIIAIIKVIGGIYFGLGSLFADGMHTFSDFVTDIVSMIGSKISKKKPTKYHPFGFGRVEYLTNLFVGLLLLCLSIFIIYNAFNEKTVIPPLTVMVILVSTFILKLIAILIMNKVGKDINSNVLITSVQESKTDLYSTIGVVIVTILLQFSNTYKVLKYADLIGSLIIGLIVLKTAFTIIIDNCLSIIGEVEEDKDTIKEVDNFLNKYEKIIDKDIELIKYGPYYKLQLTVELNQDITLRQAENLIKTIKKDIVRHRKLKIRYVTIYITDKIK